MAFSSRSVTKVTEKPVFAQVTTTKMVDSGTKMRILCFLATIFVVSFSSLSAAEAVPNCFIVEIAQDCDSDCLESVNDASQAAGCIGGVAQKLGRKPNNAETFIALHCVSTISTTTEHILKRKIEERGIIVIDIEMDNTVDQEQLLWNLDEVDSNPTDGQRCATSNLGEGVIVLVVDSGCTPSGTGNYCKNFLPLGDENDCRDTTGHGTAVASVVADKTIGVAPNATIGCMRVIDFTGRGSVLSLVGAMIESIAIAEETDRKVVVNLSLGGTRSRILNSAAKLLATRVDAVIAASGNEGRNIENFSIASVADNEKIFVVAAHDENGDEGAFSNIGEQLKISAPGVNITARTIFGEFARRTGTSFSAPHVAGAAAALFSDGKQVSLKNLITGNDTVTFTRNSEPVKKLSYDCTVVLQSDSSNQTSVSPFEQNLRGRQQFTKPSVNRKKPIR